MSARRSLGLPITLAVVMITLLAILTVGWILLSIFGAARSDGFSGFYVVLLTVGATFIVMLLVGVVLYLILSIRAITLTRRQSNFIDSVTHELKSPIASMKLCLQTLNHRQVSDEQKSEFYQFMLEDLERLDRPISELLEAARLAANRSHDSAEEVELSSLLRYFVEHEGRVIPRGELLQQVWGLSGHLNTRAPDQFVRRLRKLFEENPSAPRHFLTIRDAGYRFVAQPD